MVGKVPGCTQEESLCFALQDIGQKAGCEKLYSVRLVTVVIEMVTVIEMAMIVLVVAIVMVLVVEMVMVLVGEMVMAMARLTAMVSNPRNQV